MAVGSLPREPWRACVHAEGTAFPSAVVRGDCPVDSEDEGTACACLRDVVIFES